MINLTQNEDSKVVLFLTQIKSDPNNYNIFELTNNTSLATTTFRSANWSTNQNNYDVFTFSVVDTQGEQDLDANIPKLFIKPGEYTYKAYESVTQSYFNTSNLPLLDKGLCIVKGLTLSNTTYNITQSIKIYNF
jgi:hypothetical protein